VKIQTKLSPAQLKRALDRFWDLSARKIRLIEKNYDERKGSPVFTIKGRYTTRGWTEWTQGFQYGSAILQFDATGDTTFLESGRRDTLEKMAPHVSHIGVHDHGFNNVSTYGNLRRLMLEGKTEANAWEKHFYEMALKVSGAVQASRWTTHKTGGFIYSFNGPHSLFVDTIRSCRALVVSHELGHTLMGEGDKPVSLLGRAIEHAKSTADFSVFYGQGRDSYDVRGRTAHESIFNTNDGNFRCPNSQQGFSGFTTWTRGLAWAMVGFAEQLEYLATVDDARLEPFGGRKTIEAFMLKAATATCDFYIAHTPTDGIPYWDTGAPQLHRLKDWTKRSSDPFNPYEPIDSSAAAIGAQGLLRLGRYLQGKGKVAAKQGEPYFQAGLTVARHLFEDPYLSNDNSHQGLILHSVYHRPNGWDYIPRGQKVPCGESSMWGDYHARELALYLNRLISGEPYLTFYTQA
jgi:unsaturated chondroitin disaccharide hydrolase